ncbi:glycosyltransferase [Pseudomonas schmalbachii]|uniref:Glycosyltransferase n=1 Tax=Pseudomonas schmalbachii TaxID=2816993 RepID=A0ABS3TSX1_9PSED|nr:glycosyltransferase [Pseudomonas schmalbachii]MBO3276223.1 glycosyltransferase [Pseudomonas schmalbachii]
MSAFRLSACPDLRQSSRSTKIKVLHIYRTYYPDPPGGLQEAIRQICKSTRALEVESRVFTLSPSPTPAVVTVDGVAVTRARSWCAPASCDLGGLQTLRAFAEAAAWADILHFHFPWPFADLLNLLPVAQKPKVLTYHSDIVRQRLLGALYAPLMKATLRSMDAVIATSPTYAESSEPLQRYLPAERLEVIPLGMTDRVPATETLTRSTDVLKRLDLESNPFILALGVLRYYKGLHTLIAAAHRIRCKIVIAGSGPEEERLRSQAIQLGVDNVIFAGQVSDSEKQDLLANCEIFVLPSHLRSEAFGMVLLEASMHAKPLVCCDIGSGMSYVNKDGETGLLVPPENPEALAAAANRLLGDSELRAKMGRAARERFLSRFTDEVLGHSYARLYSDVLSRHRYDTTSPRLGPSQLG